MKQRRAPRPAEQAASKEGPPETVGEERNVIPHPIPVGRLLHWVAGVALALLGSCASDTAGSLYVHPNADFSNYRRLAVLPLENLTSERFAGEQVREILNIELAAQGLFEVVDSGEVNRALRQQNVVNVAEVGPEQSQALGQALGVQALLFGTVIQYTERRSGSLTMPDIALSLRMLDAETGIVVWAVTDARAGAKLTTRLFGVGEESQTAASLRLVRDVIQSLE